MSIRPNFRGQTALLKLHRSANCRVIRLRRSFRTRRHRPDRILVGEVRGGEAFDLLQALNTGHSGTLSTIHANSAEQAMRRFTSCVLQSGIDLPYLAIRHAMAECLQLLVHLERRRGRRVVTELVRVRGYLATSDTYALESL